MLSRGWLDSKERFHEWLLYLDALVTKNMEKNIAVIIKNILVPRCLIWRAISSKMLPALLISDDRAILEVVEKLKDTVVLNFSIHFIPF